MKLNAAMTAHKPTLTVAMEQNFPASQRIFVDELAPKLFSGSNRFWINITKYSFMRNLIVSMSEKAMTGGWSFFLIRKRFIQERLLEKFKNKEVDQILNLGAGLDTVLYRFKEFSKTSCFEADQSVNVENKKVMIEKVMGSIPSHITQLSVDLEHDNAETILSGSGYDESKKTFLILEATSQYLSSDAIDRLFTFYKKAKSGSHLAFTYVPRDFLEGTELYGQKMMYKMTVENGLWKFGLDPKEVKQFLNKYDYDLISDHTYGSLHDEYVKPTGRKLGDLEIERIVFALKR